MKRMLVLLLLLAGITFVAFASFNNNKKKVNVNKTEKKTDKPKKECRHSCIFS